MSLFFARQKKEGEAASLVYSRSLTAAAEERHVSQNVSEQHSCTRDESQDDANKWHAEGSLTMF